MNIEIDGSFLNTSFAQTMLPTAAEMGYLRLTNNIYQFEDSAEVYEETVQNMFRVLGQNSIGSILIDAINRSPNTLRIIPLTWKEQTLLGRGACARPVGLYSAKGTSCVIWFEPWSKMGNLFTTGGISPYQILVHELQHALRQMRGKYFHTDQLRTVSGHATFPNAEEMFSVTIENMYLSAEGQPQRMLGAYDQTINLGNRSDRDWYKQYGNELEVWCRDLPDMRAQLERISGIWNPIRVRRGVLDSTINLF